MLPRFFFLLATGLLGCASPDPHAPPIMPANKWTDDRAWAVLQAQDHRDVKALCAFLGDTSAMVREAAAMAMASVQDSASMQYLVPLLSDADPRVRLAASLALSFTTDTVLIAKLQRRAWEDPGATWHARLMDISLRAALNGRHTDAAFLFDHLGRGDTLVRTRAIAMLGRCPKEQLLPLEGRIIEAVPAEHDTNVRAFLLLALRHSTDPRTVELLKRTATTDGSAAVRVSALRALGKNADAAFLLDRLTDTVAAVRRTVVERLQAMPVLDGQALWEAARRQRDPATAIPLHALVMKHGDEGTRSGCRALLADMAQQDPGPYLSAELLKARWANEPDTLRAVMLRNAPAVVRQAAFGTWWTFLEEKGTHADITYEGLYRDIVGTAFASNDPGLIASVCDKLSAWKEDGCSVSDLNLLVDPSREQHARSVLHPIKDLETIQLLDALTAARDGKPAPRHAGPAFNHPIDRNRLALLQQGQRYRISTMKGDIILAIEPDIAPGTCVAFDSLVTASYYDGRYFHRVVPNFVAQGGCPRGDGYGSMDWTLRTEIGANSFTTGALGIASAGRDTESCQFFITLMPAPHLDGRYTRFAHVVSGMDVAQRLVVGDRMVRVERLERP